MASITKTARGYRAQVYVHGQRDSGTFQTRREASAWASARETQFRETQAQDPGQRVTLAEVMLRYVDEVSCGKRGERWERIRVQAMLKHPAFPFGPVGSVTPEMLGKWRDVRGKKVSAGSIIRDASLLSSILEHARREWRLISSNPMKDVRRPPSPEHRSVTITLAQIRAMLVQMDYHTGQPPRSVGQACAMAFLFALRSGMRAGEITGLTWDRVREDHVWLPVTKTTPRVVPLSVKAHRLLVRMRGWDDPLVFGIKAQTLDAMFRKYRARAGLAGFTFHDSRHTAATWMAKKVDVLTLCKIFGWSNPKMAMVYYNPKASDIAKRL